MNKGKRRILFLSLILIWMLIIFTFSSQEGGKSSKTSEFTIKAIIDIVPNSQEISNKDRQTIEENMQVPIRKLAHFSIYLIRRNFNI
ncbi:MAG TPA: VanZ family protein [Candidatus Merdicola faecigallinarum]|uniref:VanZ family protein n=1 Tax=Candidatus Merdicola faecigallinarum TaxID=2840862 RepID=A0A9D1M212_9FIRM|nr:VanZ family protein [Candidatus Merdicola faecigallinarum]